LLVGRGTPCGVNVSQRTRMLSPRLNGSGKILTGLIMTSLSVPGACPVDEPSKFHSGISARVLIGPLRLLVFDLKSRQVPPIQMYST